MKKSIALILCAIAVWSCSKSTDPVPDLATSVAGTYPVSYIRLDSANVILYEHNLPVTQGTTTLSGEIVARRDPASVVFLTEVIKLTGQSDQQTVIGQVSLKNNGSSYDMYINNHKIGTADGKTINIDDQQTDNQTGVIYRTLLNAKKG